MRLIDADALKEKLLKERDAIPLTCTERYGFGVEFPNHHGQSMRGGIKKALRCMEQTPTIDAVPVVRCLECKHTREKNEYEKNYLVEGVLICTSPDVSDDCWSAVWPDHFCYYGERKDGDG